MLGQKYVLKCFFLRENVDVHETFAKPMRKPLFAGPEPQKITANLVENQDPKKNRKHVAIYLKFHYMLASPEGSGPLFLSSKSGFCQ